MVGNRRALFSSIASHSVTKNAAALGALQLVNYAVPLLLLPYLTRQLGVNAFGLVAITLAVIQFAYTITDYGFSLSGTYDISLKRGDVAYINEKIGAIFGAKIFLLLFVVVCIFLAPVVFPSLDLPFPYIIAVILAIAAQAFQPIWLFQGLERMKNITIYMVLTKVLYAVLVISFVSGESDAIIVIYSWGAAQFLGLLVSLVFMRREGYSIAWPLFSEALGELKASSQFFWSRLSVSLYTSASTVVVGSASVAQAAHFAVCEQVYKAGQNITSPVNSAMFPFMAQHKNWKIFFSVFLVCSLTLICGCALLAYYAGPLLVLLFGQEYGVAAPILLVFLCTVVVNYVSVTFGYSAFSALERIAIANMTVVAGAIVQVVTLSLLYYLNEISGLTVACSVLVAETLVMVMRVSFFSYYRRS
tara:strand:- start:39132 stop:40382 length:1251 start_codon:yes stop_codon:yes gene_type:complete